MDPLHLLDYGALGAAMLVLLLALGLQVWTLKWMETVLSLVLARVEENTHLLLGFDNGQDAEEDV